MNVTHFVWALRALPLVCRTDMPLSSEHGLSTTVLLHSLFLSFERLESDQVLKILSELWRSLRSYLNDRSSSLSEQLLLFQTIPRDFP